MAPIAPAKSSLSFMASHPIAPDEQGASNYQLVEPPAVGLTRASTSARIGLVVLLGMAVVGLTRAGVLTRPVEAVVSAHRVKGDDRIAEMAYVVLIRHGEKGFKGDGDTNGLSLTGSHRAQYLARCMSSGDSSLAFPSGSPKYVMASHTKPEASHRAVDTARPTADALDVPLNANIHVKDYAGFHGEFFWYNEQALQHTYPSARNPPNRSAV